MHPAAVLKGAELRGTRERLDDRHRAGAARRACATCRPSLTADGERDRGARVRANRAYELIVRRGGRGPALLRSAAEVDHVEVVEIDSGEVVLFWDMHAGARPAASRAPCAADLAGLDADEFYARWRRYDSAE